MRLPLFPGPCTNLVSVFLHLSQRKCGNPEIVEMIIAYSKSKQKMEKQLMKHTSQYPYKQFAENLEIVRCHIEAETQATTQLANRITKK